MQVDSIPHTLLVGPFKVAQSLSPRYLGLLETHEGVALACCPSGCKKCMMSYRALLFNLKMSDRCERP